MRHKWTAFVLCLFFGVLGAHKFYEGKPLLGILYCFTGGFFMMGVILDLLIIMGKPEFY